MGKASRWFRGLLGLKKSDSSSPSSRQPPPPPYREKRRWSFVKSHKDRDDQDLHNSYCELENDGVDPERQAIAVVPATAAVSEAAIAAAKAAACAVTLMSSGRCFPPYAGGAGDREEWAALKIQSAFRGYLARRARCALKGLVKIQALVRGNIERKRNAIEVQQMQAVLRAQARACAGRRQISKSSRSSSKFSVSHHPGPKTPEKFEQFSWVKGAKRDQSPILRRSGSKLCGRTSSYQDTVQFGRTKSERCTDERRWALERGSSARNYPQEEEHGDKILEVDTVRPLYTPNRRNPSTSSAARHQMGPNPSPYSGEKHPLRPLNLPQKMEESLFCAADCSPRFYSTPSRGGSQRSPFTPTKGGGSKSFLTRYPDHPNYMAYTESSRAKVRSASAPKQRPQFEKSRSTKRHSIHGFGGSRPASQVSPALQASFASRAYPGSGRLNRLGMPIVQN